MAEWNESSRVRPRHRLPFRSDPAKDINILLLGETGVGKTTFINALANYLVYDTLDQALEGEMQVLIPSQFSVADVDTHTPTSITVGIPDKNELCEDNGQSQTQGCKSYLFSIGNRYLRLIDTPGVGDCRGVEQDDHNFGHVLAYISRYEHLNGICILLKPNQTRLNIYFKYGIKELLRHLHVDAKDNIMFVFTNARIDFFQPGATSTQLKLLLNEMENTTETRIPFAKANTFFFDSEAFRFLAVCQAGHNFFIKQKPNFVESWNKSVEELSRLIERIVKSDLLAVRCMESLNEAQQMIRKLSRPIGEIATLLEENIQLAEQHKKKVSQNADDITPNQIPEKTAEVISLKYPRTICTSEKCSKVTKVHGEMKVDYTVQCHEHCHLKGVEQEVIKNPILKHCRAMNKITGECKRCGCDWSNHMHVTYEFRKSLGYFKIRNRKSSHSSERIVSHIDQRISELKQEQDIIRHICAKLTLFLRVSSINPTNDDVIEYINHFIREEKQKLNAGDDNKEIIHGLEKMIKDYQDEIKLLKSNVNNEAGKSDVPTIEEIFIFKIQLCELPITGKYIQQQLESLDINQTNMIEEQEEYIQLPERAETSRNMEQLREVVT